MRNMILRLLSLPRRFCADTDAALSIEAAIMLPVLSALYVSGYQFFDGYRRDSQIYKANYAIADLISRQRNSRVITPVHLNGMERVFETMTFSEGESYMRFTEVRRMPDGLEVVWSYATDGQKKMTTARLQGFLNKVPTLAVYERVLLVESYTYDAPFFDVGLDERIIDMVVAMTPRYDSCIPFMVDTSPDATPIGCQAGGAAGGSASSGEADTSTGGVEG